MRKIKKIGVAALVLSIVAFVIPVFTGCSLGGSFRDNLTKYTMAITLHDDMRTVDVAMTVDYRNNYDVELNELHFNLFANAFREDAQFRPVAPHEVADAFTSFGGIDIHTVAVGGSAVEFTIGGEDYNVLIVPFANALMPTHRRVIDINFTVKLAEISHRLGYANGIANLGNFFPIVAVFQDNAFRTNVYYYIGDPFFSTVANFDVSITKSYNLIAAMSGKTVRGEKCENGTVATTAKICKARDFAIVVGEFNVLYYDLEDIQIRYYFVQDDEADKNLQAAIDSINTFSDMFGDYPYATFSTVKAPFLHGGMEFPALTIISDALSGSMFREVIIHEAAHQWWYAVVGNCQVYNAWIDESLAQISTSLFFERNPQYGISYTERLAESLSMLSLYAQVYRDTAHFSTAMQRPLREFRNSVEYTVMVYLKGEIMLDTVRGQIGDEAFFTALRNLYQNNKFGIITPACVIGVFETASQRQLAPFFNAWLDGSISVFGSN